MDEWRCQVAWVPQRPAILRATVAENIRVADPEALDAEVRDAAVLAGADAFVRSLPLGYETVLGDGGRQLSAGERRRIALARAFLRRAPLVVLDEPTADLDPAAADVIAEAVERLGSGRTMLLIAHRPELVQHADRIVRLQGDRAASKAESVAA
jgi:ABC-type multidrug transport system fused ATPase/permease subunit